LATTNPASLLVGTRTMNPVEMDGCSLVILAEQPRLMGADFEIIEKGTLTYDERVLTLEFDCSTERVVTEVEQREMLNVTPLNRIPVCAGYYLFILRRAS
jgi:hypothetical protein